MTLPFDARPYGRTAEFSHATVPPALLKAHTTKEGTWALIHVLAGRLRYVVDDPRRAALDIILTPETPPGVVEPTILHRVEPQGDVHFFVKFLRREPG